MKKFTLWSTTLLLCFSGFAQSPTQLLHAPDPRLQIDLTDNNLIKATNANQHPLLPSAGTRDVSWVQLGSAANGLTVLNNACNVVSANNSVNSVVFIHRNNPDETGEGTSAQYRFDFSKDGGLSFTNDIGPLNPNTPNGGAGSINGRYPQGALFNPSSAAVADSLYIAYLGSWHNGGVDLNIWDGTITGVGRVDGNENTYTETDISQNNDEVGIFTSLVESTPGTFWSMAPEWDEDDILTPVNDSNYVLLKGVWNPSTRDVEWNIHKIFNLSPDLEYDGSTYDLNPLIAFDPTGMKGWIVIGGDVIDDGLYIYQPVFFSTEDGGDTWSEPKIIDLSQFPSIVATMDYYGTGVPVTAYEAGLTVDVYGNPHYVNVIGSGSDYGIQSGLTKNLFDITYNNGTWDAIYLAKVWTFRGFVASGDAGDYNQDNRCHATRTEDGTKVFFTWVDTDSSLVDYYDPSNNPYPNLLVIGMDVTTGFRTTVRNITSLDGTFDSRAYMPVISPTCLRTASNDGTIIPTVLLQMNSSVDFDLPFSFAYLNDIIIDDTEYIVGVPSVYDENISLSLYPNPASENVIVGIPFSWSGDNVITLSNAIGQEVKVFSGVKMNNQQIELSVKDLEMGTYFLNFKGNSGSLSTRFVIAR